MSQREWICASLFVSEIERASAASKWDFWYITNSWENPVRAACPWSNLYIFYWLIPTRMHFSHIFVDIFNYSRFPRWSLNYWIFLLIVVFPLKPNCQSLNGFELPDKIMWFRMTYHHLNKSNLALISRGTNSKTHAMMTRPWWQGIEISPVKCCWFRLPQYWNHFIFVWGKVLDMKR